MLIKFTGDGKTGECVGRFKALGEGSDARIINLLIHSSQLKLLKPF